MNVLLPLPILLPLLAAGVSLGLFGRLLAQRVVSIGTCAATLVASIVLLVRVTADGVTATQIGNWPAPLGITLVADRLAAVLLVVSAALFLTVLIYALGQIESASQRALFHPVYLVLCTGVCASFLTGDLFNLFVAFEIMLTASYVLLVLGSTGPQVRSGMTYVVISLVASTMFIVALGLVYAATGTVNMADLAVRLGDVPPAVRTALSLLLLCVFGIKAAIFPLFFWLPDAYPTAPAPITALFAGLLTKVGVYALIRTQTLLFDPQGPSPLILTLAGLTMLVGVLGAIAQDDVRRILSFHIISQVGYMILGLGLFSLAGLAGAVLYIVHHIIVKTSLFLVGGMLERSTGTEALRDLGGLRGRTPVIAALFALPALSLAGIPPFSGFVAKLALLQAGLGLGRWAVVAVSLIVSALTLFSMTKIWSGVFWGDDTRIAVRRVPRTMTAATGALVALGLAVAFAAGPLWTYSEEPARELLEPDRYIAAVFGQGTAR